MIPKKLNKGDTIGIIAPSNPITEKSKPDINNSIKLLEDNEYKVVLGKYTFNNEYGYSASPESKAKDINEMFADKNIKMIFCATGGFNSNSLFDYLDYQLIKNNPKIICGFSDSTSILNAIREKTNLVTFHGPTLKSLTTWETDYGFKEVIKRFEYGDLELGTPEDEYITINKGACTGELVGGNLSLISRMVCGKYRVDFQNKILFIEDLGVESPPGMISNYLYYMKQNDVFDKISGIWVGNYESEDKIALEQILLQVLDNDYNFPIIKSNNFGHTDKKTVIPIGTMARIDTSELTKIKLLEQCVCMDA